MTSASTCSCWRTSLGAGPAAASRSTSGSASSSLSEGEKAIWAKAYQGHLLQAGFADRLLGTLLRCLHEKGLYDRALIVVTADNGESFLHRNANRHLATPGTVEDIADTPLFIKRPFEHASRISNRHVRTEDILPSIADVLGIHMPWHVDGSSVFDSSAQIPSKVDVFMRSGRRLRLSLPEFKRRIRSSLARKIHFFGEHDRPPGLFGIGPHAELIGRRVTSVPRAPVRAEIIDAAAYSSVHLRSDFLPAQLTGTIRGPGGSPPRDLAVALNGRIVAVGTSGSRSCCPKAPSARATTGSSCSPLQTTAAPYDSPP